MTGADVVATGADVAVTGADVAGLGAGDGNVVFWHTGGQLDVVARAAEALSPKVGR